MRADISTSGVIIAGEEEEEEEDNEVEEEEEGEEREEDDEEEEEEEEDAIQSYFLSQRERSSLSLSSKGMVIAGEDDSSVVGSEASDGAIYEDDGDEGGTYADFEEDDPLSLREEDFETEHLGLDDVLDRLQDISPLERKKLELQVEESGQTAKKGFFGRISAGFKKIFSRKYDNAALSSSDRLQTSESGFASGLRRFGRALKDKMSRFIVKRGPKIMSAPVNHGTREHRMENHLSSLPKELTRSSLRPLKQINTDVHHVLKALEEDLSSIKRSHEMLANFRRHLNLMSQKTRHAAFAFQRAAQETGRRLYSVEASSSVDHDLLLPT